MKNIYLDMDGVLVDWFGQAIKLFENNKNVLEKFKNGEQLHVALGISEDIMWKAINDAGHEFWENIEPLPWANKLIETAKKTAKNVYILTSPSKHLDTAEHAAKGKIRWIGKHMPDMPYIITYNKEACANNQSLLVDDTLKKCKAFKGGGGNYYLFPNQCKILDGDISLDDVLMDIESFKCQN